MLDTDRRDKPLTLSQQADKMNKRIKEQFKNIPRYRYWIVCNYFSPNHGYNFFFEVRRPRMYGRSYPLVRLEDCSLERLIRFLLIIRQSWGFTIEYRNFNRYELFAIRDAINEH